MNKLLEQSRVPELRFSGFSGDWDKLQLGQFISNIKGGASLNPSDFVIGDGETVIPKKSIVSGGKLALSRDSKTYCSKTFFNQNKNHVIDKSYLVTTLRDLVPSAPSIGYIVEILESESYLLAQGVYGFKIDEKTVLRRFLTTLSNTNFYRRMMIRVKVGSTQVHIRNNDFLTLSFYFPQLPEQQKIAHFLTQLDDKITHTQNQITQAETFKRGLLQKLFV